MAGELAAARALIEQDKRARQAAAMQAEQQSIAQPKTSDMMKMLLAAGFAPKLGSELANIGGDVIGDLTSALGLKSGGGGGGIFSSIGKSLGLGGGGGSAPNFAMPAMSNPVQPLLEQGYASSLSTQNPYLLPGGLEDVAGAELTGAGEGLATEGGLGALGNALSIAAMLHGGYNLFDNFGEGDWKSGAMSGLEIGLGAMPFLGPWSLAAAPVGALIGAAKTGKTDEATKERDDFRTFLASKGVSPREDILMTPSGEFNIGQEGGGQGAYNVDQSNPLAARASGLLNPLGELTTSGSDKASQATGMFTNASLQGADDKNLIDNIRFQYNQAGITKEEAQRGINRLLNAGKINQAEHAAYANAIGQVFG